MANAIPDSLLRSAVQGNLESAAVPEGDQTVTLHGISWELYCALDAARGEDNCSPRLNYCEGVLEIMVTGRPHEIAKKRLARLIETYAEERKIPLVGVGSYTLKKQAVQRGAEADESYIIGADRAETVEVPDFAVEIIETSGGQAKLETYKGLGVPEVWFYQHGQLSVYVLAEGFYLKVQRSQALPDLDVTLLERHMTIKDPLEAISQLRAALRGGTP